jgi:hypothetical protein
MVKNFGEHGRAYLTHDEQLHVAKLAGCDERPVPSLPTSKNFENAGVDQLAGRSPSRT